MRSPCAPVPGKSPSIFQRLLREPLVHFCVLGAALFVLADLRERPQPAGDAARSIVVTDDDLRQLAGLWRVQWNRDPAPAELRRLVADQVDEEVAFREALAAGLDRQDILVRRRLVERMRHDWATQDGAADPDEAALRRWYAENADRFAAPRQASFAVLYFSDRLRGGRAKEEAILARDGLAGQATELAATTGIGDPTELPPLAEDLTPDEAAGLYGQELAASLGRLPLGSWQGPVAVPGGYVLVDILSRTPGEPPALESVRDEVLDAWRARRREESLAKALDAARGRYAVVLPADLPGGAP
ncbi:peptidylprolyl isomerase [Solidesulfovibrio sp.]|uniref:peptidylprolyl isomerase n=1 Tax=Solidesulfovibrio sp. TaxID=2910990 RepID=UPI002637D23D|nr:peptidylprolyl isomerase [Solidesulfovibrio sp.]